MKISALKVAQAIKVGNTEKAFFKDSEYGMSLDTNGIIELSRDGEIVYTSLANAIWWKKKTNDDGHKQSKESAPRAPKKVAEKPKTKVGKPRVSKAK